MGDDICAFCSSEGTFECSACNGSTFFNPKVLYHPGTFDPPFSKTFNDELEKLRTKKLKEELRERLRRGLT